MYKLYQGDCLELMKDIPDNSVDCIICDLPYGTTPLDWDKQLDITLLWNEYKRIRKDTTPILSNSPSAQAVTAGPVFVPGSGWLKPRSICPL